MAQEIFFAEIGLGIDESISFLAQDGLPGTTAQSDDAAIGSYSTDNLTGLQYRKKTAGSGTNKWIKILDADDSTGGASDWRDPVSVKEDTVYANLAAAEVALNTGSLDGVALSDQDRVLLTGVTGSAKDIYVVTGVPGAGATFTVDTHGLHNGDQTFVLGGTSAGQQFSYNLGSDSWVFSGQSSLDELAFIRTFIGKGAAGSETPSYGTPTVVSNGDSLETGISKLDIQSQTNITNIGNNAGLIITNSTNFANLITSIGSMVSATGTYVGFTGTNFLDASTSFTNAFTLLDTAVNGSATDITNLQTEVDNIETSLGAMVDASGNYVAHTTSNYIDGNTNVTTDLLDLDAQIFTNEGNISTNATNISNAQTEIDNIETALGASVDGNGNYVAHAGTNFINGNSSVTEDITDLDTQVGTNATDISALQLANGDEANIRAFIGKGAAGVETPVYTSADVVTQNGTLEAAIGELDTHLFKERREIDLSAQTIPGFTTVTTELVDVAKAVIWQVWTQETATGDSNFTEVHGIHNGTSAADATTVKETAFAKVEAGKVNGLKFDAVLSGAGAAQTIGLQIKADNEIDISIIRTII